MAKQGMLVALTGRVQLIDILPGSHGPVEQHVLNHCWEQADLIFDKQDLGQPCLSNACCLDFEDMSLFLRLATL